jgi:Rod binding domain-containing protein
MSIPASSGLSASAGELPVVNQTLEPAWVRHGSAATQKSYQTALAFEELLVEQLSQSTTATSGMEGESGGEGEASAEGAPPGNSALSSMLPHALASGVMSAGGLGLAAQMTRQLESAAAAAQAPAGAGSAAQATGAAETQTGGSAGESAVAEIPASSATSATGGTAS